AMANQIASGTFRPVGNELAFGPGELLPPLPIPGPDGTELLLCGKIDRLDATQEKHPLYQVIDYKRGGRKFDYSTLFAGVALQLPLYLAAARAAYRTGLVAGMYYFPVADPAVEEQSADFEKALFKEFRLSGLVLNEPRVLTATDSTVSDAKKSHILPSDRSGGWLMEQEMDAVLAFAKQRAGETLEQIYAGRAELSPYKRGQYMPCGYCEYKGACGFDEKFVGCRKRTLTGMKKDGFLAMCGVKGVDEHESELDG
ncbi:MAG: PD-(D/E)XK nuclease family protein, partial [Clostridia bacterium]|nr:PD-(D/E)XK nuclease family protein [Clostridia bacterium]